MSRDQDSDHIDLKPKINMNPLEVETNVLPKVELHTNAQSDVSESVNDDVEPKPGVEPKVRSKVQMDTPAEESRLTPPAIDLALREEADTARPQVVDAGIIKDVETGPSPVLDIGLKTDVDVPAPPIIQATPEPSTVIEAAPKTDNKAKPRVARPQVSVPRESTLSRHGAPSVSWEEDSDQEEHARRAFKVTLAWFATVAVAGLIGYLGAGYFGSGRGLTQASDFPSKNKIYKGFTEPIKSTGKDKTYLLVYNEASIYYYPKARKVDVILRLYEDELGNKAALRKKMVEQNRAMRQVLKNVLPDYPEAEEYIRMGWRNTAPVNTCREHGTGKIGVHGKAKRCNERTQALPVRFGNVVLTHVFMDSGWVDASTRRNSRRRRSWDKCFTLVDASAETQWHPANTDWQKATYGENYLILD